MDCDFQLIVPELRDLFDLIAAGHAGAIGSRFSHDSILINYPFAKIIANRAFHLLVRWLLHRPVRDISNNLKLYRADILKELDDHAPDFGANVETGLKPMLAGHDIREVPTSWVARTEDMGTSSFSVLRFAPSYVRALGRSPPDVGERQARERWRDVSPTPTVLRHTITARASAIAAALDRRAGSVLALLLVVLVAATALLAARAPLWNDELFTYYIAGLPSAGDVWSELATGVEQTPFSFYLVTRAATHILGDQPLALRVPRCSASR